MFSQNKQTLQNGDKVRIVKCGHNVKQMQNKVGTETQIKKLFCWTSTTEWYELENNDYIWRLDWLKLIEETKINISQNDVEEMFR